MKKSVLIYALCFCLILLVSISCGEREKNTLVIGSNIPYAPFEMTDESGNIVGFDVDIAKAIFEDQLGYSVKFKRNSFDTIIPALNNGNFRVIMSAMTITDSRAEKVDFSDPYFTAYQTVVVLKESDIHSKKDLQGKTVGVQKGTTGEIAAEDIKKEFEGKLEIKKYDQGPDAFNALINNQVNALIMDNMASRQKVDSREMFRFVMGEGKAAEIEGVKVPPYLTLSVEQYGIAFRKDDDEFRREVNKALKRIKESGKYRKIFRRYF